MHEPKKMLCIAAGQRTGTTALQSALGSTGAFYDFGEIFQTAPSRRMGAFLDHARSKKLQIADVATPEDIKPHLDAYFDSLDDISGSDSYPLIDVKLNSWGALRSFWSYFHEEPLILSQLKERGARFIFLARKDITAQILSEQIARHVNKWHDLCDGDVNTSLTVDVGVAATRARLVAMAEQTLFEFMRNSREVFPVWYEDLYVDEVIKSSLIAWLGQHFDLTLPTPPTPVIKRNKGDKKSLIANFDEVDAAIKAEIAKCGRVRFQSY